MFSLENPPSFTVGAAQSANRSASEWQAYAAVLEKELKIAKAENFGYAAVRDQAILELKKLDPANYLLVQQNRRNIFERARDEQLKGKRAA